MNFCKAQEKAKDPEESEEKGHTEEAHWSSHAPPVSGTPFEQARNLVNMWPNYVDVKLSNESKIKFYAWSKQGTVGTCKEKGGKQPPADQEEARAKWDAWSKLGDMSADDAKKAYVDEFVKLTKDSKNYKFVPK